jgi:uncharacterized membrane protein YphA (DoxX/SURF4 family)
VDIALLAVRVIAGVIFAAHGAQKLFGGPGLAAVVEMMGPSGTQSRSASSSAGWA